MREMTEIITPLLHMNGDSKRTLIADLEAAYLAVLRAQEALYACSGNPRNFYPEPGRFEKYKAQHWERQAHLQAVRDSLIAEVNRIEEENPGRR